MRAWVARDANNRLYIHYIKPHKRISMTDVREWISVNFKRIDDTDLPEGINPQWSDDEPIEVELKIEKV